MNLTYAAVIFIGALIPFALIAFAMRIGWYVRKEYRTGIAYAGEKTDGH